MQLLFEQYFTDALDFSRELYKKLRNSTEIYPDGDDVVYKLTDDPIIDVVFTKAPNESMQTALGGFYRATKGKRSTVTLKNGKKARRMLVLGGEIVINVANIIQQYRHLFSMYKKLAPAIIRVKKNNYKFSDDISALHFATIVKTLIETNFFAHVFAHEVQHFYNPWVHKRAEAHRKVKTDLPLTQEEQRNLNYLRSNAEVDSRTIEAAVRVIGDQGMQHVFNKNTPENQGKFVKACMQDLINTEVWFVYPEWLHNKLIKRWSKIYQHEMQRRSHAGKR